MARQWPRSSIDDSAGAAASPEPASRPGPGTPTRNPVRRPPAQSGRAARWVPVRSGPAPAAVAGCQGRMDSASALAAAGSIGSLPVPSHTTNHRSVALAHCGAFGVRRAHHTGPDLTVGLGGVGELHLVGREGTRHVAGLQRTGLLVDPGAGERHEELAHVGGQPDGGLAVVAARRRRTASGRAGRAARWCRWRSGRAGRSAQARSPCSAGPGRSSAARRPTTTQPAGST